MPDCLYFTVLAEIEQTIEARAHGYASGICVGGTECAEHLALHVFHPSCLLIVYLVRGVEEPVHSVAYARGDVDVFEQGEVRQSNLEVVRHSVLHLVPESRLVEL